MNYAIQLFNELPQGIPDLTMATEIDEDIQNALTISGAIIDKSIVDVQCSKSKANKIQSAYKHIEFALKKIEFDEKKKKTMNELDPEHFNADLVGKLANYFANHARSRCSNQLDLLSCTTACGYMAAIKTFFNFKYR